MARAATTNQELTADLSSLVGGRPRLTMAGWVRRPSSGTIQTFGFNDTGSNRFTVQVWSDNNFYASMDTGGGGGYPVSAISFTGWAHVAAVFRGTNANASRVRLFVNGSELSTTVFGTLPTSVASAANIGIWRMNRAVANSTYGSGDYADLAIWSEDLTAEELAALAKGFAARHIRPSALLSYMPLIRELQDVRSGIAVTDVSTTYADHPPIIL